MNAKERIEKLGIKIFDDRKQPYDDDFEPIDYTFSDGEDNVAWLWGSHPTNDINYECNHPESCIDWGDDDECGECLLCGDQCFWHWEEGEEYEGTDEDGCIVSCKWGDRVIDDWHRTGNRGLLGKMMKEELEKW